MRIIRAYRFVSDHESRALQTCHQHLMRVPGNRVGSDQNHKAGGEVTTGNDQHFTLLRGNDAFIRTAACLPVDAL